MQFTGYVTCSMFYKVIMCINDADIICEKIIAIEQVCSIIIQCHFFLSYLQTTFIRTEIIDGVVCFKSPEEIKGPITHICSKVRV